MNTNPSKIYPLTKSKKRQSQAAIQATAGRIRPRKIPPDRLSRGISFCFGAPTGNRTPNLLIKSQLLCQLSYRRQELLKCLGMLSEAALNLPNAPIDVKKRRLKVLVGLDLLAQLIRF